MSDFTLNRRQFIKLGSIAGGGFALGLPKIAMEVLS